MERFRKLKNIKCFSTALESLKQKYIYLTSSDNTALTPELFDLFYKTGSRLEYENAYFTRRGILTASSLLYFIYGHQEYKKTMLEMIKSICDEKTWALPAHIPQNCDKPECVIDLFNSETAQTLAEICYICADEMDCKLHDKIHDEINRRIVTVFTNNKQGWETAHHNWAAVCGGSVGMALLYEFPSVFKSVENRIVSTMNSYLSGFGDDGICSEGIGYWKYGFLYFTAFAELYKERCGVNLLNGEKIKNIARCQQYMIFENGMSVSFSDCSRNESFDLPLAHFYRRIFGDDIDVPDDTISECMDNCNRYIGASRAFLWFDENTATNCGSDISERYFEDVKWYINKRKNFSFAAKAGHNDESHNHNDIGSFIIASDGIQIIADYGAGEYTREYFSEKRYDIICNSSLGHSVPIIDGIGQSAGRDFSGKVLTHSGGVFSVEISGAYDIKALKTLERKFEISDICIKISDLYKFDDDKTHDITERFISVIKPRVIGNKLMIGSTVLVSDYIPEIKECHLKDHEGNDDMIYFIDYNKINSSFELCIKKTP